MTTPDSLKIRKMDLPNTARVNFGFTRISYPHLIL